MMGDLILSVITRLTDAHVIKNPACARRLSTGFTTVVTASQAIRRKSHQQNRSVLPTQVSVHLFPCDSQPPYQTPTGQLPRSLAQSLMPSLYIQAARSHYGHYDIDTTDDDSFESNQTVVGKPSYCY
jgi:hypothetical protein